jgi:dolichol-phosphate mannosyltransferase
MERLSLSVLIPAYNEASTLAALVGEVVDVVGNLHIDYEIILCDDASTDSTKEIIKDLLRSYPKARAIFHERNQGLFKTFEELYQSASKELVILFPGDGQWSPKLLPKAISMMGSYDVVIAGRLQKQYTAFRKINSWLFNSLVWVLYRVNLYDIGAVKLVRRSILQGIPVGTSSAFSEAERLLKAHKAGYKIGVIWVEHKERKTGKAGGARLPYIIQAFTDLVIFRLRY